MVANSSLYRINLSNRLNGMINTSEEERRSSNKQGKSQLFKTYPNQTHGG
jgi:hypothetical protein